MVQKIASFYLESMDCVALYSFVVLKSVTYLDLSLGELSSLRGKKENVIYPNYNLNRSTVVTTNFVCTQEGVKKSLAKNRKILYDLHLDVSRGLELRFGNYDPSKIRYHSDGVLLNKMGIVSRLFEKRLELYSTCILKQSDEKVKILHKISKLAQRVNFIEKYGYIRRQGSYILYDNCWDSNIVKDFLILMDFEEDGQILNIRPQVLGYLLYHASCAGYQLKNYHDEDLINVAMSNMQYEHVPLFIQYRGAPKLTNCESTHGEMVNILRSEGFISGVPFKNLFAPVRNGLQTLERNYLLLQIFFVFFFSRDSGLRALQLVWRSVSQAFISLDELIACYPEMYGTEFLENIHNYISDVTGVESYHPEPRSLKHYCRTAVRRALSSNAKLFSGIDKISVPPSMLAFLKLEQ